MTNPEQLIAAIIGGGITSGGLIKLGTWLFGEMAKRTAERRVDRDDLIRQQKERCDELEKDIEEERQRIEDLRARYDARCGVYEDKLRDANQARQVMEGILLRQGWKPADLPGRAPPDNPPVGGG